MTRNKEGGTGRMGRAERVWLLRRWEVGPIDET